MEIGIIICIILQAVIIGLMLYKRYEEHTETQHSQDIQNKQNQLLSAMYSKHSTQLNDSMSYIQEDLRRILREQNYSQSKMEDVYKTMTSVNNIMTNKKLRGNFGEYQLSHLLSLYAGESSEIYETQYKLDNNLIADVALRLPDESRVLVIDSKFPLENYMHMQNDHIAESEYNRYKSLFVLNVKKHIDDISKKYITKETLESAVMFIPSEAIYFYICSQCCELIDYAHKKHVLITSPTTLLGVVFTLVNITKDMKRTKNIKALEKDIVNMFEDVNRLRERLAKMDRALETINNTNREVKISCEKISSKVEKIYSGYSEDEM